MMIRCLTRKLQSSSRESWRVSSPLRKISAMVIATLPKMKLQMTIPLLKPSWLVSLPHLNNSATQASSRRDRIRSLRLTMNSRQ